MEVKIKRIPFLVLVALLLIVPAVTVEREENYISPMDNKTMAAFPEKWWENLSGVEAYVNDRIGFRDEMITAYQYKDYFLYHVMSHPLYQMGKQGELYTKEWDPVTYQHLDGTDGYPEAMADFLLHLQNYCKEQGMGFCFLLAPNKESIYPEYYADGYGIMDQPNRTDRIMEQLLEKGVNHVDPRERLMEEKADRRVYNRAYDVGHWNTYGMYVCVRALYEEYLEKAYPQLAPLREDEFDRSITYNTYLPNSYFRVDEPEEVFSLKEDHAVLQWDATVNDTYLKGWKNDQKSDMPKVLIFGDSYFGHADTYFTEHFSEVSLLHVSNMWDFYGCLERLQPDVVIVEGSERVFDTSMYYMFNWETEDFAALMQQEY